MKPWEINPRPTQTFSPGNTLPFVLPLDGLITKGTVVVDGSITVVNAGGAGTAVRDFLACLVNRVIIHTTASPNSPYKDADVVDCSGVALLRYAISQQRRYVGGTGAGVALGAGAAGVYPIHLEIPVFFTDLNYRLGNATALNAWPSAHQSIVVNVKCGTGTDMFVGNAGTWDFSGLQVGWVDERVNSTSSPVILIQEDHRTLIDATRKDFQDRHPRDGSFLQWLVMTESAAIPAYNDGMLNAIKLEGETVKFNEIKASTLRQRMLNDNWADIAETLTGQYFLDLANGSIGNAVPAKSLDHTMDITMISATNVDATHVYTRRVFGLVPAA